MSYTYATFQSALAQEMAIPNANVSDPLFVAILPSIIDYAEQWLYRDLDLLFATQTLVTPLTQFLRTLTLPTYSSGTSYFVEVEDVNVITPVGQANPEKGVRNQCTPVSKEWLDAVWGNQRNMAVPTNFAMLNDSTILFGPWPDQGYNVEIVGKYRPAPLYQGNVPTNTTYLSTQLPDLFLAAAMVSATGYQKNYGAQADNPRDANSWLAEANKLLATAKMEDQRRKFHGYQSVTSQSTPPPPTPPAA